LKNNKTQGRILTQVISKIVNEEGLDKKVYIKCMPTPLNINITIINLKR